MDDQTEVPVEREVFRVKYQDAGLFGPSYTRPMSYKAANLRRQLMLTQDGISDVEIVDAEVIADEKASLFRLEGTDEHQRMIDAAKSYHEAQQRQISGDVDNSLEEPAIGAFSTLPEEPTEEQLDDWEKALEEEVSEPTAKACSSATWNQQQNRHTALDHAMALATRTPIGMSVVVAGPTAEKVVENARVFLAFLNEEEGTGA